MATLLDGSDVDQQTGGVAPGLLNEGAPVSNDKGPLGVLFPAGPYGNVPGLNLKSLRRNQLLDLGSRLLAASGPKPQGTSSALSDVGGALGGAVQDWRQQLPQAANAAMQLTQFQYQMAGRQAMAAAMRDVGPQPGPGASPAAMSMWATKVASKLAASGSPGAQPYISQFAELAKTFHDSASDIHYEDGVTLTPEDAKTNPALAQYVGQYGVLGRDAKTGAVQSFNPKQALTPSEKVSKGIEWRKAFTDEIKPGNNSARAYQALKSITGTEKTDDISRLKLLGQMLQEGGGTPGISPTEGKNIQEQLMELLTSAGRLTDAARAHITTLADQVAGQWKTHNKSVYAHFTHPPFDVDTTNYVDEWSDLLNPAATPAPGPKPGGRVQSLIDKHGTP